MRSIDTNKLIDLTLVYLGDHEGKQRETLNSELKRCFSELDSHSSYRECFAIYEIVVADNTVSFPILNLNIESKSLSKVLRPYKKAVVMASTLGVSMESYLRRIQTCDIAHSIVLDAAASAYLEIKSDLSQLIRFGDDSSFRFAPGYGDLPLELNARFASELDIYTNIGVSILPNYLFVPQKTILGIIGIEKE